MDVTRVVTEVDAELRSLGTPERAQREKAYLKSDLQHYGAPVPAIRSVVKAACRRHDFGHDDVITLAGALWAAPVHERRMASVELLTLRRAALRPSDMPILGRFLRESRTWALVDALATSVVGYLVEQHQEIEPVLDRWAKDDDFWIRRSALLALLPGLRRGAGDFARFSTYADTMLDEKEFFIRKAIGWVLRETAKKRPDLVYEWLLPRAGRASGVTMREGIKPLPVELRDTILRAT